MTQGHVNKKILYLRIFRDLVEKIVVFEIHFFNPWLYLIISQIFIAMFIPKINLWSDSYVFEYHVILSECTCFVRKNVINLPKLFVEIRAVNNTHLLIMRLKICISHQYFGLEILDKLNGHHHGYWNEISEY